MQTQRMPEADVRVVYAKIGRRIIAEPSAIEIFNFNIERIKSPIPDTANALM